MSRIIIYIFLGIGLFSAHMAQAEGFQIEQIKPQYLLTSHLEIFHDEEQSLSFEDIQMRASEFIPYPNWTKDILPKSVYWGKIDLTNQLEDATDFSEWVLKFSIIFTDIELYVVNSKGIVKTYRTGFFVNPKERDFTPKIKGNIIKFNLPAGESSTIFFKGKNERRSIPVEFDLSLQHSATYFSELEKEKQWNAMFIGFVLMMFIYNLFLYFFSLDRAYLNYSIYILAIAFFTAYNSGDLADWLNHFSLLNNPKLIHFYKISAYLIIVSYLLFIRYFLDLKNLLPRWDFIFKWLGILSVPVLLIDCYLMWNSNFSYNVVDVITFGWALVFVLLGYVFLIPLYKTKDPKGVYVIVGFVFMGIGVLLTTWLRLQYVDFSVIYFRVGVILEIILFSLGLAYRQKEVEEEQRQAAFELERSKILQDIEHMEAERLKELNTLKSRLYANITHEFRTPLTVIMGMADNIKSSETKELIQRNSNNLLQLINQLLDLSKAESGHLKAEMIQGDIINFLQYLTESFHSMAAAKNIQLTFYTEEKILLMDFDEQKIQHIIYNLLSNAIKYTPENGKVIFHVKKDNSSLCLKVKDTGEGISTENQPYVFDRFFKTDTSSTAKGRGIGIGLALTKELVEFLDGKISLLSEQGEGSEFMVYLPITNNAKLQQEENQNELAQTIEQSTANDSQNSTIEKLLEGNKNELPLVLVVEDNEDVLTYIQSCLDDTYQVSIAKDGEEGINKAIETIPDIIISDLMMPKKNGFEVCRTLKDDERTSHVPIILLTAKATQEDKIEGLETGADAYMMKPFHKQELIVRLKKLIENRKALQAKYGNGVFSIPNSPANVEDEFLQKIIKVIHEELDNPKLTVADLGKKLNLSSTQMYRKVKALTGFPPNKFMRQIRLQKGMELLKTSSETISEIAYQVGFNDPNYFSRTFSEQFGKTPSEIRK